jgi:hypothetical protein
MSAKPDDEAIDMLLDAIAGEGPARLVFPREAGAPVASMPHDWIALIEGSETPAAFIRRTWAPVQALLPRTCELLAARTSAIALLATAMRPPSLVYMFGLSKDLLASRGFAPDPEWTPAYRAGDWPMDLAPLLSVHDGWVDFFSHDGGVLPSREWRVIGEGEAPLLEVFRNGAAAVGVDFSVAKPAVVLLDPDADAVLPIADFWSWLDDFHASSLEEMDDA